MSQYRNKSQDTRKDRETGKVSEGVEGFSGIKGEGLSGDTNPVDRRFYYQPPEEFEDLSFDDNVEAWKSLPNKPRRNRYGLLKAGTNYGYPLLDIEALTKAKTGEFLSRRPRLQKLGLLEVAVDIAAFICNLVDSGVIFFCRKKANESDYTRLCHNITVCYPSVPFFKTNLKTDNRKCPEELKHIIEYFDLFKPFFLNIKDSGLDNIMRALKTRSGDRKRKIVQAQSFMDFFKKKAASGVSSVLEEDQVAESLANLLKKSIGKIAHSVKDTISNALPKVVHDICASVCSMFGLVFTTISELPTIFLIIAGIVLLLSTYDLLFQDSKMFSMVYKVIGTTLGFTNIVEPQNIQPEVVAQGSGSVTHIYSLVALLTAWFVGSSISMKTVSDTLRLTHYSGGLVEYMFSNIQKIIGFIMASITGDDTYLVQDELSDVLQFIKDSEDILNVENVTTKLVVDEGLSRRIQIMYLRASELTIVVAKIPAVRSAIALQFNIVRVKITNLYKLCLINSSVYVARKEPICVLLTGPPGLGKTTSMNLMYNLLYRYAHENFPQKFPVSRDGANILYSKSKTSVYWEKYAGQFAVVEDEFLQTLDALQRTNSCTDFLQLASSGPFPLDSACMEGKGTSFFSSSFFGAMTNFSDWEKVPIGDPKAFYRRWHFPLQLVEKKTMLDVSSSIEDVCGAWRFRLIDIAREHTDMFLAMPEAFKKEPNKVFTFGEVMHEMFKIFHASQIETPVTSWLNDKNAAAFMQNVSKPRDDGKGTGLKVDAQGYFSSFLNYFVWRQDTVPQLENKKETFVIDLKWLYQQDPDMDEILNSKIFKSIYEDPRFQGSEEFLKATGAFIPSGKILPIDMFGGIEPYDHTQLPDDFCVAAEHAKRARSPEEEDEMNFSWTEILINYRASKIPRYQDQLDFKYYVQEAKKIYPDPKKIPLKFQLYLVHYIFKKILGLAKGDLNVYNLMSKFFFYQDYRIFVSGGLGTWKTSHFFADPYVLDMIAELQRDRLRTQYEIDTIDGFLGPMANILVSRRVYWTDKTKDTEVTPGEVAVALWLLGLKGNAALIGFFQVTIGNMCKLVYSPPGVCDTFRQLLADMTTAITEFLMMPFSASREDKFTDKDPCLDVVLYPIMGMISSYVCYRLIRKIVGKVYSVIGNYLFPGMTGPMAVETQAYVKGSQGLKGVELPKNMVEAQNANNKRMHDVVSKYAANIVTAKVFLDNGWSLDVHLVFLDGRTCHTALHSLKAHGREIVSIVFGPCTITKGTGGSLTVARKNFFLKEFPNRDGCLITFDEKSGVNRFKTMGGKILSSKQLSKLASIEQSFRIWKRKEDGVIMLIPAGSVVPSSTPKGGLSAAVYLPDNTAVYVHYDTYYTVVGGEGNPGDCGLPYYACIDNEIYYLGMHSARSGNDSIMSPIYTEDLVIIEAQGLVLPSFFPEILRDTCYPREGTDAAGRFKKQVTGFAKNDLVKTRLNALYPEGSSHRKEAIYTLGVEPAKVEPDRGYNPWTKSDLSLMRTQSLPMPEALQYALDVDPSHVWRGFDYDVNCRFLPKRLTLEEACFGIPSYVNSLDDTTSGGLYGNFFGIKRNKMFSVQDQTISDEFRNHVQELSDIASAGDIPVVDCNENLKVELRTIGKYPRMFSAVGPQHIAWTKMVIGDLVAHLKKHSSLNACKVGINPHCVDWDLLGRSLFADGWNNIAGDISGMDVSIHPFFLLLFFLWANAWYRYEKGSKEYNELKGCLMSFGYMLRVRGSRAWYLFRGHPSGHYLTGLFNAFVIFVIHRYHFYQVYPGSGINKFSEAVRLAVYGDDNAGAVHPDFSDFNMLSLQKCFMEEFGMIYTNPSKEAITTKYLKPKDVEFLSRSFLKINGTYRGLLKSDSIEGMLLYVRDSDDNVEQLNINIRMAQLEAFHGGRQFYDKFVTHLQQHCRERKVFAKFYPYEFFLNHYVNGAFGSDFNTSLLDNHFEL